MNETPEERAERHYALARYWEEQHRYDTAVLSSRVAELEHVLREIVAMDPDNKRADDLGRAARAARKALEREVAGLRAQVATLRA